MYISYSARSHIGAVREQNEDNLFIDGVVLVPEIMERPFSIDGVANVPEIFAVCDGMGGEDSGEIASQIMVEVLRRHSDRIKSARPDDIVHCVQAYVNEANRAMQAAARASGRRMGTTIALLVAAPEGLYCFNIGDSRIYSLLDGGLQRVTNDHTLAAEQVRSGALTPQRAMHEKSRHKLTRCVGIGEAHTVENYPRIKAGGRFLLCSDGLTNLVGDDAIAAVLRQHRHTANAASELLQLALLAGGFDNITVLVGDVKKTRANGIRGLITKWKQRICV